MTPIPPRPGKPGAAAHKEHPMTTKKPILLVPVDFSDTSRKALEFARTLAPRLGAEVVLLHVFERPLPMYSDVPPALIETFYGTALPAAERALADLAESCGGLRTVFREGRSGPEIVTVAEEMSPELIVMGTHGRRGLGRVFFGSTAEYVLRRTRVPVTTVRYEPEPQTEAAAAA